MKSGATTWCSRRRSAATRTGGRSSDLRRMFSYIFDTGPRAGGGVPKLSLFEIGGPFSIGGVEVVPDPADARPAADSRLPRRVVRLSDRLQPHSRIGRGRCSKASARSSSTRFAIGRTPRISPWTKRCRSSNASGPNAPASRTSATICRTPRPVRGSRPAWSWPMMGWSWRSRNKQQRRTSRHATGTEASGGLSRLSSSRVAQFSVSVDGHHPFSRRSAAAALDEAGAGAGQFRRPASRSPQDPRPREPGRRRAWRDRAW